jgi:O-succinylbenzoate synthase
MIDELVKYISANPTVTATMTIPGQEIRRANRVQVSNTFDGYANFLVLKVPTTVIAKPAQNAWHKRCGQTSMDYVNEKYPPLVDSSKKPCMSANKTTATADSTNATDSTIVDLEAELEKEHAHHDKRLEEMRQTLTNEITKMKLEFTKEMTKAIEDSKEDDQHYPEAHWRNHAHLQRSRPPHGTQGARTHYKLDGNNAQDQ